jgi:hypothetical protein
MQDTQTAEYRTKYGVTRFVIALFLAIDVKIFIEIHIGAVKDQ